MEEEKIINAKILVIDDDVNMMEMLSVVLEKYGHTVSTYTEPVSAIEELKINQYDILIVNYLMTPVKGDRIVELVREFNKDIYIILMSVHKDLSPSIEVMKQLDIQAYFEKSNRFDQLILMIQSGIKYIEQINKIKNMDKKLEHYLVDFAQILLKIVGAKDHFTEEHSRRVAMLCSIFAKKLKLDPKSFSDLQIAATFHDIGKIGIPDNILLNNGKLSDEEYTTIKLHPVIGANILAVSDIYKDICPIIYCHHERIDGKGYPQGIKGDKIPYLAKALTICDSFDAIVSKRPYKEEASIEFAISEIKKNSGTQFDKELAESFIELVENNKDQIEKILNEY
ncbi:MAG: HD domain-containing protein [Clostridia bacterium]|nr:HD domain-containing protein [Clostridia bacterium]